MKQAALAAVILLCVALIVAVAVVTPHVERALDAVASVGPALADVHSIEIDTQRTEAELAGLLNETRHIAMDERADQQAQLAQVADIGRRVDVLLDAADGAVTSIGQIAPVVSSAVSGIAVDTHQTAVSSQVMLSAATADLADPALRQSEDNVAAASADLAATTKQAAASMTDVHAALDHEIKVIEAPVSKGKAALLFTASLMQHLFGL